MVAPKNCSYFVLLTAANGVAASKPTLTTNLVSLYYFQGSTPYINSISVEEVVGDFTS